MVHGEREAKAGKRNSLVILIWNEIDAIRKLYGMIPFGAVDEAVVIDGGSDDGTAEFLRAKDLPVYRQKKKGRGAAFLEGLRHTSGENIIFLSGDGNEDPKDIPRMIRHLDGGYDMVIAGRYIFRESSSDSSDDPLRMRMLFGIGLGFLIRVFWGGSVRDSINGFRGFRRPAMESMNLDAQKYDIEFQTTIRALKLGLRIKEFPTKELRRMGGYHKPSAGTLVLAYNFFKFFFRELIIGMDFRNNSG